MNGTIDDISGKQSYTVGATANDGQKKTVLQGIALAMNEISSTGSGATVHGMVKMTNLGPEGPKPTFAPIPGSLGPQGTYPVNIALEPVDRITFRWEVGSKIDFTKVSYSSLFENVRFEMYFSRSNAIFELLLSFRDDPKLTDR